MAHLDSFAPEQLNKVVKEIADFASKGVQAGPEVGALLEEHAEGVAAGPELRVTETLTIWKLKPGTLRNLVESHMTRDVADYVEQTRFRYHQIRRKETPVGFARSEDAKEKSVFHMNISALALRIHEALEMIDRNEQGDIVASSDPVVRLLEIPASHILALWLYAETRRESRVVIIDAAKRYTALERGSFLTSKQFFDGLSRGGPILNVA